MATLDELIVRIEADVSGLKRGLASAERSTQRSSTRMGRAFGGLNKSLTRITAGVGSLRGALAGLGAIVIGRQIVKTFTEFEQSLGKIVGLVGVNRSVVQAWEKDILALSKTTGRHPNERASAHFFVISAGLRIQAAMEEIE